MKILSLIFLSFLATNAGSMEFEARIDWSRRVELGTLVSGVVAKVPVRTGQQVRKGQILLALERREFRAALAQAQAGEASDTRELAEAERENERALELFERTVISEHERDLAAIELAQVQARVAVSTAALVQAQLNIERSRIRAPFAGLVLAVRAQPGQVVVSELQSQPLIVLADNEKLLARAAISADVIGDLALNQAVLVEIAGQSMSGKIAFIGFEPLPDQADSYPLEVVFDRSDTLVVRKGQKALIRLNDVKR